MQKRSVAKCPLSFRIALRGKQNASMPGRAPEASVVETQVAASVPVRFPASRIGADQCSLPRPIREIYHPQSWLVEAGGHFCALDACNILILDLYSFSATLANYSSFLSHDDNSRPTRRMLFLDRPARRFRPRKFLMLSGSGSLESAVLASSCGPN